MQSKFPQSLPLQINDRVLHLIEVDAGAQRFVYTDTTATYVYFEGHTRSFEQRSVQYPAAPAGMRWDIEATLEHLNQWHALELLGRPSGMSAKEAQLKFQQNLCAAGGTSWYNYLILSLKPA